MLFFYCKASFSIVLLLSIWVSVALFTGSVLQAAVRGLGVLKSALETQIYLRIFPSLTFGC